MHRVPTRPEVTPTAWGRTPTGARAGHLVQISASLPGENRAGQLQLQFDGSLEGVSQMALGSARSLPLPVVPRGLHEASGSHLVPGLFHEVVALLLQDLQEVERRRALVLVGVLGLASLGAEDVVEVRQRLASGLPGDLL